MGQAEEQRHCNGGGVHCDGIAFRARQLVRYKPFCGIADSLCKCKGCIVPLLSAGWGAGFSGQYDIG